MSSLIAWILRAIPFGTIIMYGALGETLTEKSGNLNLGVPGIMYLGGFAGFASAYYYEKLSANPSAFVCVILALLCALIASALGGLIYAFLTITLKANQNVSGLALTTFGTGVANFLGTSLQKSSASVVVVPASVVNVFKPLDMGFLSDLPVVGQLIFSHSLFTYLAVALAIGMHLYLNKTHCGLNLRAIGENPGAADAAGVNVTLYKYVHLLVGGAICGLGGAYISLVTCAGNWQQDCVSGQGWIAVALVIFVSWKPAKALWGAFFFGALRILKLYVPASVISLPSAFYLMLPFAVTCVVLVLSSIRMRRENQAPAACGVNYFREER